MTRQLLLLSDLPKAYTCKPSNASASQRRGHACATDEALVRCGPASRLLLHGDAVVRRAGARAVATSPERKPDRGVARDLHCNGCPRVERRGPGVDAGVR